MASASSLLLRSSTCLPGVIEYDGETEFARTVYGQTTEKVMPVMDEMMDAVSVLQPRLYDSCMQKLREAR